MDGGFVVAGATGVVKVFDSTSGALLLVLANPGLAADDLYSAARWRSSGTRVVVGVSQYAHGWHSAALALSVFSQFHLWVPTRSLCASHPS
jgi:hypothetical protein